MGSSERSSVVRYPSRQVPKTPIPVRWAPNRGHRPAVQLHPVPLRPVTVQSRRVQVRVRRVEPQERRVQVPARLVAVQPEVPVWPAPAPILVHVPPGQVRVLPVPARPVQALRHARRGHVQAPLAPVQLPFPGPRDPIRPVPAHRVPLQAAPGQFHRERAPIQVRRPNLKRDWARVPVNCRGT